uniref:CAZy families CE4 protein n=1 Tax=uncultured Conexibacter sp. TaxID=259313 RepID=A0A060BPW9_9ACTN|nr:CAZy families CE4 protein [uncultured Conexibacter sp.]
MGQDYTVYHARTGDIIAPDAPMQFGRPAEVVEIPVSWSLDDYPYFEYLRTPSGLLARAPQTPGSI